MDFCPFDPLCQSERFFWRWTFRENKNNFLNNHRYKCHMYECMNVWMRLIKYEEGFFDCTENGSGALPKIETWRCDHYSMNHKSTSDRKHVVHKEDISLNKYTNFVSIAQSMTSQGQLQNVLSRAVDTTSPAGGAKNRHGLNCETMTQINSKPLGKTNLSPPPHTPWLTCLRESGEKHSLWGKVVCAGHEYLWWLLAFLISWIIFFGKNNNTFFLMTFDVS